MEVDLCYAFKYSININNNNIVIFICLLAIHKNYVNMTNTTDDILYNFLSTDLIFLFEAICNLSTSCIFVIIYFRIQNNNNVHDFIFDV